MTRYLNVQSSVPLPSTRLGGVLVLLTLFALRLEAAEPSRVITLGGAVTEIAWALGAGERVIATDASSTYPAAAAALPKVGYFRTLGIEPLLALAPDLVLASEHAGPPAVLEQLARAGVEVERIDDAPSADGITRKIAQVAAALGLEEAGVTLSGQVEAALTAARAQVSARTGTPRVLFLLSAGPQGLMAAGSDTAADALIALLGAQNVFAAHSGYAPASAEALATQPVDYVLVSARSLDTLGGSDAVRALPGLAALRLDAARIVAVDDLATLSFGPRLPAGLAELAARLVESR